MSRACAGRQPLTPDEARHLIGTFVRVSDRAKAKGTARTDGPHMLRARLVAVSERGNKVTVHPQGHRHHEVVPISAVYRWKAGDHKAVAIGNITHDDIRAANRAARPRSPVDGS